MHFIVTGASGFVGGHLVRHLGASGHSGLAISRRSLSGLPPGWRWQSRDAALRNGVGDAFPESILVHLEVHHHVQVETATEREKFNEVNVRGTSVWLDWCDRNAIKRFVLFSSIKAVRPAEGITDETAEGPGDTDYGASKWEAEKVVHRWGSSIDERRALIVRPAVVYGHGNAGNMGSLVAAVRRGRFVLIGGGITRKSVVSAQNVCAAVDFLASRMQPGIEVYNLTDATTPTVAELACFVSEALGKRPRFPDLPASIIRLAAYVGDLFVRLTGRKAPLTTRMLSALLSETQFCCDKLKARGFQHPQTTREGIVEMVRSGQA